MYANTASRMASNIPPPSQQPPGPHAPSASHNNNNNMSNNLSSASTYTSMDDDKGRGSYKCGRCGVPKKGHICPYQPKVKRRPGDPMPEMKCISTQVEMDEVRVLMFIVFFLLFTSPPSLVYFDLRHTHTGLFVSFACCISNNI